MTPGAITLRIDDDRRSELEAMARGRGQTVSDLIRESIDAHLGRSEDRSQVRTGPPSLSLVERSSLAFQHRMLASLESADEYDREHHLKVATVLENGFTGEYDMVFAHLDPELSVAQCHLVWELLDMFRILQSSFSLLDDAQRAEVGEHAEHALSFRGFDFNDEVEAKLARYTAFLVAQDRWTEQIPVIARDGGNSHSPMLATYRRMLSVYSPLWSEVVADFSRGAEGLNLNLDQLKAVYAAWLHPRR